MKVNLIGNAELDVFIPMDISGEPYATEWSGEFNEEQFLWVMKNYPECKVIPFFSYTTEKDSEGLYKRKFWGIEIHLNEYICF